MYCPKCGGLFEDISKEEADSHRCKVCSGLWFPNGANHSALSADASTLDTGDPTIGKIYDLIPDVNCQPAKLKWHRSLILTKNIFATKFVEGVTAFILTQVSFPTSLSNQKTFQEFET